MVVIITMKNVIKRDGTYYFRIARQNRLGKIGFFSPGVDQTGCAECKAASEFLIALGVIMYAVRRVIQIVGIHPHRMRG